MEKENFEEVKVEATSGAVPGLKLFHLESLCTKTKLDKNKFNN